MAVRVILEHLRSLPALMQSALPGVVATGLEAWFIASDVQPEILTWLAIVEHNPASGTSARRARINMPDEDLP
jgi:hypothetical protein